MADLDAITNVVFAAMHEGDPVATDRYLPPAAADEWHAVRHALEKMPIDALVDLCRLKGALVIARQLVR